MHFMPLNTASDAKVNSTCHIVTSIWNITKLLALLRLIKFNSTSSTAQTQLQLSRGTGMQGRWKPSFVTHIATGSPQVFFLANTWNKHVCHPYCKMFWPQGMITKQQGNNIAQNTTSTQPMSQDAKGGSSAGMPVQPPHEFFFLTFLLNHGLQKLVPHLLHYALAMHQHVFWMPPLPHRLIVISGCILAAQQWI